MSKRDNDGTYGVKTSADNAALRFAFRKTAVGACLLASFFPIDAFGSDAAAALAGVQQQRQDLARIESFDCKTLEPLAIRSIDGILSRYLELHCTAAGQVLVAKPSHYVAACIRDCSREQIFASASRNALRSKPLAERESFNRLEVVQLSSEERWNIKLLGPNRPISLLEASEKTFKTSMADVPLHRLTISSVEGWTEKFILFEPPNPSNALKLFLEASENEVIPFELNIIPLEWFENKARKNPLTDG